MQSTQDPPDGKHLEFADTVTVASTKTELWEHIHDPAFIARCVPGIQSVEKMSEQLYTGEVSRGIGHLTLTVTGEVEIIDQHEPDWLITEGRAYDERTHTDFIGAAAMELEQLDDGTVDLAYEATLTFNGGGAALPTRLLRTIVESDVEAYFENIKAAAQDDGSSGR